MSGEYIIVRDGKSSFKISKKAYEILEKIIRKELEKQVKPDE